MVYGRVIGNELRDVPPECLPIWGQRWSGYRAPHGPSPFSTRIFSADRMSEVGPVLTSPTQFEMTLTEEDEKEVTSPESGQFYSSFLSSPSAIHMGATELPSRPEAPIPLTIHHLSNRSHGSPSIPYRSIGNSTPQESTYSSTALLPGQQVTPIQDGYGSLDSDYPPWDMDHTLTSVQLQTSHFQPSPIPCRHLEHATVPLPISEWHFTDTHTQSSAYPYQINPSQPDGDCLSLPFQGAYNWAGSPFTPTSLTVSLPRQSAVTDSSRDYESSTIMTLGIPHHPYSAVPPPQPGTTLYNSTCPEPLQISVSASGPGVFYHLVTDRHR